MPGSQREALQVFRDGIVGTAAVRALIKGRIYNQHPRPADVGAADAFPLAVIAPISGHLGYEAALQELSVEVRVYSRTSSDHALTIYEAIQDAAHGQRLTTTGLDPAVVGYEQTRPAAAWEEAYGAWLVRTRWVVRTPG